MALRYRFRWSSNQGRDAAIEVKSGIREILNLTDDTVVSIASHACGGVDCGDAVAVILLGRSGYSTTRHQSGPARSAAARSGRARARGASAANRDHRLISSLTLNKDCPCLKLRHRFLSPS
jgi:hypothetical protein